MIFVNYNISRNYNGLFFLFREKFNCTMSSCMIFLSRKLNENLCKVSLAVISWRAKSVLCLHARRFKRWAPRSWRKYFPREWWTRDCRWRWQVEVKIDVGRNVMTYLRFSYLCDSTAASICGKPFISSNGLPATFRRRLSINPTIKGGRNARDIRISSHF